MVEAFPIHLEQADGSILLVNKAREEESEEIFAFQEEHYYQKSPLRQVIGYDSPPDAELFPQVRLKRMRERLRQHFSLTVRNSTGRLVAIVINEVKERPEVDPTEDADSVSVNEALNRDVDLFALYQTDRIMHLWQLAVHVEYVHCDLAVKLIQLTMDLASATNGVQAVKVRSFNKFAFRVLVSLGFTIIKSIDYFSFEPANSSTADQQCSASLMARRVSSKQIPVQNFTIFTV